MGEVVDAAQSVLRRFGDPWHADVADPVAMAGLRARVVVATCLLGVASTAASGLSQVRSDGVAHAMRVAVPIAAFLLIIAVVVAWRGSRTGEWTFAALLATGNVFATLGVASSDGSGQVAKTALAFVVPIVLGAVFLERRRLLTAELIFAIGLLLIVARQAPTWTHPFTDVGSATVGLVVMAASVRLMRDRAISAVHQARRGEVTDPLTGLTNRRGLERYGTLHWQHHARTSQHLAALVIDIDHFKRINDTQGHAAGDQILHRLGNLLPTMLRSDDIAVRLGGEEFLVLCTVPAGTARVVTERLHDALERELHPVTVSIGVHEFLPTLTDTLPEAIWGVVDSADQALYDAKASGRNRVACTT